MFTGIIESVGAVREVTDRESTRVFRVTAPDFAAELSPGESIAVDGACLTAVEADDETFTVEVIGTTLERTVAGRYGVGSPMNLERAMVRGARLDGHIVQGHVDGVGHLIQVVKDGEYWLMDFRIPGDVIDQTILHGSICLNGVSLTVSDILADDVVQIGIIPYTWEHTNLGRMSPGDPVNVEGDLIGKYVGRILATRTQQ